MGFSKLFIDRPILAAVISVLIMLLGAVAYLGLPVSQYPEVAPPTISVTATYPGANAETVAATVASPLEQEINGVEGMLYLSSQSTSDGRLAITVTFALGTDLDEAQVLVQNRVNIALPRLPEEVRRLGLVTLKNSPDILLVVHIYSPDNSRDQLYLSNYTLVNIRDRLARLDGVGDIRLFGAREYSMRIWLDPHRVASLGMTAGEVVQALRAQNVQVAGGVLDRPPSTAARRLRGQRPAARPSHRTRLQFGDVLLKSGADGRLVRVRDIGRIELGAVDYSTNAYLDDKPAVAVPVFQRPGSNALATAHGHPDADGGAAPGVPTRARLRHRLQPVGVHRGIGDRGSEDDFRGRPARRGCRGPLPPVVAGVGHSAPGDSRLAHRHVRRAAGVWILAEHAVAVRSRPGDRHRRGRCDCRGRERRAKPRTRA